MFQLSAVAGIANADPAAPTNYRSVVTALDPTPIGVEVTVVGGDAFLQIEVARGHTATVNGYFDEPYVRVDTDQRVWVNEGSPAYYINRDRYGVTGVPDGIDANNPPSWVAVADDGRYAWHDHRVHWMSFDRPPTVTGDVEQTVFPWELPVIIDSTETIVSGELIWIPSKSPIPAALAGVVVLLPVALWGIRSSVTRRTMLWTATVVGTLVSAVQFIGTPVSARGVSFGLVLVALALIAVITASFMRRTHRPTSRWFEFFAALAMIGWFIATIPTMWMPVLPSTLSPVVERAGVAMVGWAALGAAGLTAVLIVSATREESQ